MIDISIFFVLDLPGRAKHKKTIRCEVFGFLPTEYSSIHEMSRFGCQTFVFQRCYKTDIPIVGKVFIPIEIKML